MAIAKKSTHVFVSNFIGYLLFNFFILLLYIIVMSDRDIYLGYDFRYFLTPSREGA